MGETLAWYGTHGLRCNVLQASVTEAVSTLTDRDLATPAASSAQAVTIRLEAPGHYAWWVDEPGSRDFASGLGLPLASELFVRRWRHVLRNP